MTESRLAYLYAVVWVAAAGVFLFHVPFEISETLGNLVRYPSTPPAHRIFIDTFLADGPAQSGFLRTFTLATNKLLFDASAGHYFATYRALHVALLLLLIVCLVRLIRVQSPLMLGLAVLAGTMMLGMHTFHEAVREDQLNIKLMIPALCFGILCLSVSRPRRWKDIAAIALMFYAVFANELGLLLWVGLASAYLVGFRGVSRPAVLTATGLIAVYFVLRFVLWDVGGPGLTERSSGFGFRMLDPPELIARFGANPLPLYAYNVVAAVLTVLVAEPRSGVFVFVRGVLDRAVSAGLWLEVVTSVLTTAIMMWFVARRWRVWWRRDVDYYDGVFLVCAAMVAGNAVISYPYLKEVVMSTGGAFYVLATVVALRSLIMDLTARTLVFWRGMALCVLLGAVSVGWTLRGVSFFVDLSRYGTDIQRQWRAMKVPPEDGTRGSEVIASVRAQMDELRVPGLEDAPRWLDALDRDH